MTALPTIHIAYADDHVLVRKGIIALLAAFPDIVVDAEVSNGKELIRYLTTAKEKPDICIMDIHMPELDGFETLREIKKRWPEANVLIVTAHDTEAYIMRMIQDGAGGYLLKSCSIEEMHKALRSIYNQGVYYSDTVSRQYFIAIQNRQRRLPNITEQEMAVLRQCCSDLSYAEIARRLGTTARSVEGHRDALFKKLNVNSRVSLALYAVHTGLITIEMGIPGSSKLFRTK